MNHADPNITKIQYAKYLAASLAYLASLQGDATGLYVFKNDGIFSMTPKQDYQHLARLFYQLSEINPKGTFTKQIEYSALFSGAQKRELLVFITDLYQKENDIYRLLDTLCSLRHEIVVFHLLARNEMELNFQGFSTFEDLETGETIQIDQNKARTAYRKNLENYLAQTRIEMLDRKISYRPLTIDEPLDQALRDFLKQRNKLKI